MEEEEPTGEIQVAVMEQGWVQVHIGPGGEHFEGECQKIHLHPEEAETIGFALIESAAAGREIRRADPEYADEFEDEDDPPEPPYVTV